MQNAGTPLFIDGLNRPRDSQNGYHFASMAAGSKLLSSSIGARRKRNVRGPEIIAEQLARRRRMHPRPRMFGTPQISRPIARAIAPLAARMRGIDDNRQMRLALEDRTMIMMVSWKKSGGLWA